MRLTSAISRVLEAGAIQRVLSYLPSAGLNLGTYAGVDNSHQRIGQCAPEGSNGGELHLDLIRAMSPDSSCLSKCLAGSGLESNG